MAFRPILPEPVGETCGWIVRMLDQTRKPPAREREGDLQGLIREAFGILDGRALACADMSGLLAAGIAMQYLRTRPLSPEALVRLVASLREILGGGEVPSALRPAVPVEQSVTPDFIICLEDGHPCKSLQRYLKNRFGLTPQAYRLRWGLPPDYPMVAEHYSRRRAELARANRLGRYSRDKSGS